jgi:hypothetical protein
MTPRPRRIGAARVAVATLVVLGLIVVSALYHDGVLAAQDVAAATEAGGSYRLKGTIEDVDDEGFSLTDDSGSIRVAWNVTTPLAGQKYVVVGTYNATAGWLDGEAVVRVYVFR